MISTLATLKCGDVLVFKRACGCFAPAGERVTIFSVGPHHNSITVSNVSGERKGFTAEEAYLYFKL